MTEYTPTTETVRYAYAAHKAHYGGERGYQKQATEFDRWLAERDRQVAERAWERGWLDEPYKRIDENPYRKEATGE